MSLIIPTIERWMKQKKVLFPIIAIAVLVGFILFYFLFWGHPRRQVLAQVNEKKITLSEFNQELAKIESPLREMYHEEPQQFLEVIITKRLLLEEAGKQGLSAPIKTYKDTEKDALSSEDSLITELMKKKFSSPSEVTREEIKTFYTIYKEQMKGKSLDQVASAIEQIIREGKQRERVEQFIKELRNTAKVEIDQIRLKKIAAKPPDSNTEEDLKKALMSGIPVLVDFGANACIPCRQMRPFLKEIDQESKGKAKILVIDVYKHSDVARTHQIQVIPTLVFFDSKGKEVFRHLGVLNKEQITMKLKEIGMAS